jgi:ribosomal protein S11
MFLLHISKNKLERSNLQQIAHLKKLNREIKKQISFFNSLKKNKKFKSLRFLLSKNLKKNCLIFRSKTLINYIIGISIYRTNIILYLSDVKGIIKFFITSGSLGIKRKQKKKKIAVLIKLIKFMMLKVKSISKNDLIALHLKNFNERLGSFTSVFLSKYYNIELVKINTNQPHNGCRPRKVKRKKRRNLNFDKNS